MSADLSRLPPMARELAGCVGLEATLALVRSWGGARVVVPAAPTPEWVEVLGPAAAEALCQRFAHETIDVPRCVAQVRATRDAAIVAALEGGMTLNQAALAFGLTRRQIVSIRLAARSPAPATTGDLFE